MPSSYWLNSHKGTKTLTGFFTTFYARRAFYNSAAHEIGAAALTRNELALDDFLGFRRARRQIDRSDVFTSSAHNRFVREMLEDPHVDP